MLSDEDAADFEVLRDVTIVTVFGFLYMGCTLTPPGEYDWTIDVRWRCGLMSNYFDHLLLLLLLLHNTVKRQWIYGKVLLKTWLKKLTLSRRVHHHSIYCGIIVLFSASQRDTMHQVETSDIRALIDSSPAAFRLLTGFLYQLAHRLFHNMFCRSVKKQRAILHMSLTGS